MNQNLDLQRWDGVKTKIPTVEKEEGSMDNIFLEYIIYSWMSSTLCLVFSSCYPCT